MVMMPVLDKKGKKKDQIEFSDDLFGKHVNADVIHQAVVMYQASLRQGNASTKERGSVSGGGKKPYRQKGTGRARQGSTRAPQFIGGGVVFGPHPRDFGYDIPKKIRRAALKESINAKLKADQLIVIEELTSALGKTKEFADILKALKMTGRTLALLDGSDASIHLVSRNIPRFEILRAEDVTAYDIMRNKNLLLTKTAVEKILERINK